MSASMAQSSSADRVIRFRGSDAEFRELCATLLKVELQQNNSDSVSKFFSGLGSQAQSSPRSVEKFIILLEEFDKLKPSAQFVLGVTAGLMIARTQFSSYKKQAGLDAIQRFFDGFKET